MNSFQCLGVLTCPEQHQELLFIRENHSTYVKRGVARSGKIIYVGNPKWLDGHRAHAKEQLSAGHERPQVARVGQTPGLASAAPRVARIPLEVTNVLAIWTTRERGGGVGEGVIERQIGEENVNRKTDSETSCQASDCRCLTTLIS